MDRSLGSSVLRRLLMVAGLGLVAASNTAFALEPCGTGMYPFPYTDVSSVGAAFCPGIMEAYVTGVSKGTTPTTFGPNNTVTRVQMTTFLQRSLDQALARTSRRAALDQWWTSRLAASTQTTSVGAPPNYCAADGEYIWVTADNLDQFLVQVQASTGQELATWSDSTFNGGKFSVGVRVAAGKVFVARGTSPGIIYFIDPLQPPNNFAFSFIGNQPIGIAFDGSYLWTANRGPPGSVSIITADAVLGLVSTVTAGFNAPYGILYDGSNIWVTDTAAGTLLKLDGSGNIVQTVIVGTSPAFPVFDGANIWVPNYADSSITVVQASTGNVVATITSDASNQLDGPNGASFDGERILIANYAGNSVTLFKAADLRFIANMSTGNGTKPIAACSDGINFWVPLQGTTNLLRY
jgi:DNA-binding beta-propeller fold protein YncE